MIILDGKAVSSHIREGLQARIQQFQGKYGRAPQLTVVIVGDDPASQVYVQNKHRACEAVGMASEIIRLPAAATQTELEQTIRKLNESSSVDGILLQLPVPKHLSAEAALSILDPSKDADGLTDSMMGKLWAGRSIVLPCTPQGVMRILNYYKIDIAGKNAVVVGRSQIVGKPMVCLLAAADATVTMCHSKTQKLREYTTAADIVVVAAGRPRFLGKDDFKPGAIVIDVGIHRISDGKICGDVRIDEVRDIVGAITPVPGGVGPMTITCLLENTLVLAEVRAEKKMGKNS